MPLIFLLTKNTPRSNFKITSIMSQSQKNLYRRQVATILAHLLAKFPASEECVHYDDGPLFQDTCNFVGLRHELQSFVDFLRDACKYSELCEME